MGTVLRLDAPRIAPISRLEMLHENVTEKLMRTPTRTAALAAAFSIAMALSAQAGVRVTVDDGVRGANNIARYVERLGERYLKPGQDLDVTILDYRKARERDPFFRHRFGIHRPYGYGHWRWRDPFFDDFDRFDRRPGTLKLRYTLRENGRTVKSDTDTITSWDDFDRGFGSGFSDQRDDVRRWFRREFASER